MIGPMPAPPPIASPIDRLAEFLGRVVPFNLLPAEALRDTAGRLQIEYFPEGTIILEQRGRPAAFAYIIQTGAVRVFLPADERLGQDLLVDIRAEGEMFGVFSLLENAPPRFNVAAGEDSLCLLLDGQTFKALLSAHPDFGRHYARSLRRSTGTFYHAAEDRGRAARTGPTGPAGPGQADLLIGQVREVMKTDVLTCRPFTPVIVAARGMSERRVGSIVVVDESGAPEGLITDTDLRDKIVARDRRAEEAAAAEIMSRPLTTVGPLDPLHQATILMTRGGFSHLPVVDADGRLVGVVSEHDLLVLTGSTPVSLIADIDRCQSVDELVARRREADRVTARLVRRGGSAEQLTGLITELNDRLTRRLIELAEDRLAGEGRGRPPVAYAWLALGSEGRREQTLRTDQDNALVFANVPERHVAEVQAYFLALGRAVVDGLVRLGFPRCQGGIMAENPTWCQPEAVWRRYFIEWLEDPDPTRLRLATIFFDLRSVRADADLAAGLIGLITERLKSARLFLRHLAATALYNRPPLGFFRQLVVEKSGDHKNKLNLKLAGQTPIVDGARVLGLDSGGFAVNTLDRLEAARRAGGVDSGLLDDLADAHGFLTLLRLQHHLDRKRQGLGPDNYVDPDQLTRLQRQSLKEVFGLVSRFQEVLENRYQVRQLR